MPLREFNNGSFTYGDFSLVGEEEGRAVPGSCRVKDGVVELTVSRNLTSNMRREGDSIVPADEVTNFTVHGHVATSPQKLTIIGMRTVRRHQQISTLWKPESPTVQELRGNWLFAGAHLTSADRFTGVRISSTHLAAWSKRGKPVLECKPNEERSALAELGFVFRTPEAQTAPFTAFGERSNLRLSWGAELPLAEPDQGRIHTRSLLELNGLSDWTFDELLTRFINPLEALFTACSEQKCRTTSLEVAVDGSWYHVYGLGVSPAAETTESVFVTLDELSLEMISSWCNAQPTIAPAPNVIAAAVAGQFTEVETESLALTTAGERLDRGLYPDERRFTQQEVSASIDGLAGADIPETVKKSFEDALTKWWFESSYPQRIARLGKHASRVAPSLIGRANRWKKMIVDLRHSLAHGLANGTDPFSSEQVLQMASAVRSLRWALVVRLMAVAGMEDGAVRCCLSRSEQFTRDEDFWMEQHPSVYEDQARLNNADEDDYSDE